MATSVAGAETKAAVSEACVRDAMLGWFRGEFAAANAIIDELCGHLAQIGSVEEYESSFAAIHRRRLNWIPVLHMQKYYTIAEVAAELRLVSANRSGDYCLLEDSRGSDLEKSTEQESAPVVEEAIDGARVPMEELEPPAEVMQSEAQMAPEENDGTPTEEAAESERDALGKFEPPAEAAMQAESDAAPEEEKSDAAEAALATDSAIDLEEPLEHAGEVYSGDSSDHKGVEDGDQANGGSQAESASTQNPNACGEQSVSGMAGRERIKILKGFVAKESVKGHMVNVLKGLKMYEGIFTNSELLSVTEFINELRLAGRNGELSGETFIFFNKQVKGNKREIIQFGVPLFQSATEEAASNIEPIPATLQAVIDNLVQWRLIPESRKPNSCIINFFDEDEHSQPYLKPPHLDNPISTLVLSDTTMAFGRSLVSDQDGNYKGSLALPIKEGTLLVMRGNSADMARHVVCSSPNRRVIITFTRVRPTTYQTDSPTALKSLAHRQPSSPLPLPLPPSPEAPVAGVAAWPAAVIPTAWGLALHSPIIVLAPAPPPRRTTSPPSPGGKKSPHGGGTGVFLPWAVPAPKKYAKNLPPRFQKGKLSSLLSPPLEARA
ncbi:RNA demethylase ALKBH10B-like [Zingiber officinale]|uniref:RNA demethylase ALKBH10B-like n=1 Tax=Zingiber officinale TaxID=94328 RepID=UPI001C4D43EF|nr:RNA demethylase ALKBH10B-like [Zingiber officinale]